MSDEARDPSTSSSASEPSEYDGTGTGHDPYGERGYHDDGGRGQEVCDALEKELAESFGADDTAHEHLSDRMLAEDQRGDGVPRLAEDDSRDGVFDDRWAEATDDGLDDRHELSAEESAMHYVDDPALDALD